MRVLCFSDLHMQPTHKDPFRANKALWIAGLCNTYQPDVCVVAGDITESHDGFNTYKLLHNLFQGYPVVFCLGNHEFFGFDPVSVREKFERTYDPDKYDVHCLDVIGHHDIGDVRFLGNVLWYDGSMKCDEDQNMYEWGEDKAESTRAMREYRRMQKEGCYSSPPHISKWKDYLIKGFDYELEFEHCYSQIKAHYDDSMVQVLVTHCVPHKKINQHECPSPFNAYSGCGWLLDKHDFHYSISGHTHKRDINRCINGCSCVNVGDAFFEPYEHFVLDIEGV